MGEKGLCGDLAGGRGGLRSTPRRLDPCWIDEALEATGTATLRRRRLPAERVVWLALDRLGEEPQKRLCERGAEKWGHERARRRTWRELAVCGVDSTKVRVPDSPQLGGFRCFLWLYARAARPTHRTPFAHGDSAFSERHWD
jgi:hypothetical protein